MTLSPDSRTLSPLPQVLTQGLPAAATAGALSFLLSTSLFSFLTYKLISWRRKTGSQVSTNQVFVLIYNLLLADVQQAIAFLLNAVSLRRNSILVGSSECWAQGWFISTGDLASSVFIFAIAIHTFMAVVKGYKLPSFIFYTAIVCLWIFVYAMAIIGALIHPKDIYVRAGAWCWINAAYQSERLYLHYLWIFVCMFSTVIIYILIFMTLRSRSQSSLSSPSSSSNSPIPPATPLKLMLLYPTIYTFCTLPLAAGRIATMSGRTVPLSYFCAAAALIACNGWLDVFLYALTRRSIVFAAEAPSDDAVGIATFWAPGMNKDQLRLGNTTTIEAGNPLGVNGPVGVRGGKGRTSSTASTENLYKAGHLSGGGGASGPRGFTITELNHHNHVQQPREYQSPLEKRGGHGDGRYSTGGLGQHPIAAMNDTTIKVQRQVVVDSFELDDIDRRQRKALQEGLESRERILGSNNGNGETQLHGKGWDGELDDDLSGDEEQEERSGGRGSPRRPGRSGRSSGRGRSFDESDL